MTNNKTIISIEARIPNKSRLQE